MKRNAFVALTLGAALTASAHDVEFKHLHGSTNAATPLKFIVEKDGPIKAPAPLTEKVSVSGQGFWKFAAARAPMVPPGEVTNSLKPAHATMIVDA